FSQAGAYTFRATITDQGGLSITSDVIVSVDQTVSSIVLTPASVTLANGGTQQFTATAKDQFGKAMSTSLTWSLGGLGGTLSAVSGGELYTAPASGSGTATVQATNGSVTGTALVTVASVPAAPTNLVATLLSGPRRVSLTWADNATNETGYKIYRSSDGGKTWTLVGQSGANVTSFADTSVGKHKEYLYRVLAFNDVGTSDFSNIVTVLT